MFLTPLRGVIKSTRGIVMYYKKSFKRRGGYSSFRGRKSSVRRGKRIKKIRRKPWRYTLVMRCTKPIRLMHLNHVEYPDGLLVPCGKCLACRIARRQEWSMRVIHELAGYKDAVF